MEEKIAEIAPNGNLGSLDCAKKDANEFSCLAEVSTPEGGAMLTLAVTCEDECIWTTENYALQP